MHRGQREPQGARAVELHSLKRALSSSKMFLTRRRTAKCCTNESDKSPARVISTAALNEAARPGGALRIPCVSGKRGSRNGDCPFVFFSSLRFRVFRFHVPGWQSSPPLRTSAAEIPCCRMNASTGAMRKSWAAGDRSPAETPHATGRRSRPKVTLPTRPTIQASTGKGSPEHKVHAQIVTVERYACDDGHDLLRVRRHNDTPAHLACPGRRFQCWHSASCEKSHHSVVERHCSSRSTTTAQQNATPTQQRHASAIAAKSRNEQLSRSAVWRRSAPRAPQADTPAKRVRGRSLPEHPEGEAVLIKKTQAQAEGAGQRSRSREGLRVRAKKRGAVGGIDVGRGRRHSAHRPWPYSTARVGYLS